MPEKTQSFDDKMSAVKATLEDIWDFRLDAIGTFKGMAIDEVLALTVEDLLRFGKEDPEHYNVNLSKIVTEATDKAVKLEI